MSASRSPRALQFACVLALAAASAIPARATLGVNGAAENEVTTGATDTVTLSISSGHLVAIFCRQGTNNTTNMTVTDSSGGSNTWTQTSSGYASASTTSRSAFFYSSLAANVTSVTCNWTGTSGRISAVLYDITGAATSSIQDSSVNATNGGTGITTFTSGSLTTANANDILLFGVSTGTNNTTYTPGTGFAVQSGGSGNRAVMSYEIVSATQSGVTTTMGFGTSSASIVSVFAAFKAAAAGGGATPGFNKRRKLDKLEQAVIGRLFPGAALLAMREDFLR